MDQNALIMAGIVVFIMAALFSHAGGLDALGGILKVFETPRLLGLFALSLFFPMVWGEVKEVWHLLWVFGIIALLS